MEKTEAGNLKKYFIFTYVIFWLLLGLTGYLISLDVPLLLQNILKNISSAAPTLIIIIMFKKLYPNITVKEYLKLHFMKTIKLGDFFFSFLLQLLLAAAAVLSYFLIRNVPLKSITFIASSSVIPVLIMDLTSGALGEELGWRGYVLNILQKKFTPLTSGVIVGMIWGMWHLPLMILSGYSGLELTQYMVSFMVAVVSFSVIITLFYIKSKNILIAMWMHFWFNFLLKIVIIDLLPLLTYIAAGYLVSAILIVLINKDKLISRTLIGENK